MRKNECPPIKDAKKVVCNCNAVPGPHGTTHKKTCAVIIDFNRRFDAATPKARNPEDW